MRTPRNRVVLRAAAIAAAIGLTTLMLSAPTWGAKGGGTSRYAIVPLDTRPGYQRSGTNDVNEVGEVVGWMEDEVGYVEAMLWEVTASGGTVSVVQYPLPLPSGVVVNSDATGINDSGQAVGQVTLASGAPSVSVRKAVYWKDRDSTPITLAPLPGHNHSVATSINNAGVVVGMSFYAIGDGQERAVAWKVSPSGNLLAGPVDLGVLPTHPDFSIAENVSNTDTSGIVRVVGTSGSTGTPTAGPRAVLWEIDADTLLGSGPVDLGVLREDRPYARGYTINDQGTTCGDSQGIAFRKPYGSPMQQLAQFKPGHTYAYGINNGNEIVGQNVYLDRRGWWMGTYPVMWQADGKVLNLNSFIGSSGWYYIALPRAINDKGWIAAHGGNSAIGESGESRALVMVPK